MKKVTLGRRVEERVTHRVGTLHLPDSLDVTAVDQFTCDPTTLITLEQAQEIARLFQAGIRE